MGPQYIWHPEDHTYRPGNHHQPANPNPWDNPVVAVGAPNPWTHTPEPGVPGTFVYAQRPAAAPVAQNRGHQYIWYPDGHHENNPGGNNNDHHPAAPNPWDAPAPNTWDAPAPLAEPPSPPNIPLPERHVHWGPDVRGHHADAPTMAAMAAMTGHQPQVAAVPLVAYPFAIPSYYLMAMPVVAPCKASCVKAIETTC